MSDTSNRWDPPQWRIIQAGVEYDRAVAGVQSALAVQADAEAKYADAVQASQSREDETIEVRRSDVRYIIEALLDYTDALDEGEVEEEILRLTQAVEA